MTGREYIQTQITIIEIGKQISTLNLGEFLKTIDNALAVAPMTDPVLFAKASENMRAIKNLALALLKTKTAFVESQEIVIKTALKKKEEL